MNKRHIPGFFDALARTPSFVFLCSMFLCGAAAGGLTGLHAAEKSMSQVARKVLHTPSQISRMRWRANSFTCKSMVRIVPLSTASPGITLAAEPACSEHTVSTII